MELREAEEASAIHMQVAWTMFDAERKDGDMYNQFVRCANTMRYHLECSYKEVQELKEAGCTVVPWLEKVRLR